jgi:hypothetical protein
VSEPKNFIKTFLSPAGFIEQHYYGSPSPTEVLTSIKELESLILHKRAGKDPLVLIDISKITRVDLSIKMLGTRIEAVKLMRSLPYKKAAIYGPVAIQVIVNTLATVAGTKVRHKIKCFNDRTEALKWLKSKS